MVLMYCMINLRDSELRVMHADIGELYRQLHEDVSMRSVQFIDICTPVIHRLCNKDLVLGLCRFAKFHLHAASVDSTYGIIRQSDGNARDPDLEYMHIDTRGAIGILPVEEA